MTTSPATIRDLSQALEAAPADARVRFETEIAQAKPGYHVTELRLAQVQSIDCMGNRRDEQQGHLQILDGGFGAAMQAGKLKAILQKSTNALPDLLDAPLVVEFSPENNALGLYSLGAVTHSSADVAITLNAAKAQCRPAVKAKTEGRECCA